MASKRDLERRLDAVDDDLERDTLAQAWRDALSPDDEVDE